VNGRLPLTLGPLLLNLARALPLSVAPTPITLAKSPGEFAVSH